MLFVLLEVIPIKNKGPIKSNKVFMSFLENELAKLFKALRH
jgi:hypothetical protein